jgi:hypothetical protein
MLPEVFINVFNVAFLRIGSNCDVPITCAAHAQCVSMVGCQCNSCYDGRRSTGTRAAPHTSWLRLQGIRMGRDATYETATATLVTQT